MALPNERLRSWIARSGLSNRELARVVGEVAAARGQGQIRPDASSVRRWIEGMQPRHPVPDLLADIISRRAGVRVTTYDLGLGDPSEDRALVYHSSWAETIESVADLGRADVDRRTFLLTAPFAASATLGPSRDWLLNTLDQMPSWRPRVDLRDIAAIREKFVEFQEMDIFKGGDAGRLRLTRYTSEHVIPLLRGSQRETVHQALSGAAAEQVYLLGWMAYDSGKHGVAQRYLIQALRLAEESHDPALGAHVLAGMSDQATLLGDPEEGKRLAQAGRHGLGSTRSPACLADLWVLEARAAAVLGDSVGASRAAAAAERAFEQIQVEDEPEWARFIDQAYVFGELANAFRDIGNSEEAADRAARSIRATEQQKRARRGALSHAALAAAHLQRGELEAAHRDGLKTIKLAQKVKSSRSVEAVSDIAQRMRRIGPHPLVTDFCEKARIFVAA